MVRENSESTGTSCAKKMRSLPPDWRKRLTCTACPALPCAVMRATRMPGARSSVIEGRGFQLSSCSVATPLRLFGPTR